MSKQKLPKYLTADDQRALLDTFNRERWTGHRNWMTCRFMLDTGLRAGEVVALRDEHLEFAAEGGVVHCREGKGGKDRDLEIDWYLRDQLREWLERRDEKCPDSEVVFPTSDGSAQTTRNLGATIKKAARTAEVNEADEVSCHTLRHSFARDLYMKTGNLRVVQEALGHKSISTTQIYTAIADEDRARALRTFRGRGNGEDESVDEERYELLEMYESAPPEQRRIAKKILEMGAEQ